VACPDQTTTTGILVEQGDTVVTEFTWTGTNTGPMVLHDGTELQATGKRLEFKGMDIMQVRDGKAAVHHQYWDNMAFARQLGLIP
jgi:ketosteroid isomerase-like protein